MKHGLIYYLNAIFIFEQMSYVRRDFLVSLPSGGVAESWRVDDGQRERNAESVFVVNTW
jgi:hypothetical protein